MRKGGILNDIDKAKLQAGRERARIDGIKDKKMTTGTVENSIRTKDGTIKAIKYIRSEAIKLFCVECLGWEDSPDICTAKICPLYPFRGKTLLSM